MLRPGSTTAPSTPLIAPLAAPRTARPRRPGLKAAALAGLLALPLLLPATSRAQETTAADASQPTAPAADAGGGETRTEVAEAKTAEARAAIAAAQEEDANDPLEGMNRAIFWFNEGVDTVLLRPAAKVYRTVVPDFAQTGIRNVLWNLRSPLTLANKLLQGDWDGASVATERFLINSTIGLGGLIDVAGDHGLTYEYESFDQTLAVWGVPEGFYLVLPFLGSSTLRDAVGFGVEAYGDPVSRYLSNTHDDWASYTRAGVYAVDLRAQYLDVLDDMKRNSVDYYATMRSLYRQRQNNYIRNGKVDPDQFPSIPDYDSK
ncbi:MlaA family lipoprotein [Nitrospirillum pindoramense]|uniref:Phospholipid-binding lipoprotein MlaA n=1 Tax=Nitrospirillum amazonense TaxID=28077 RepID=A0A560H826_9PROT|nr:VacJ family lipoprotein [Nitrospirillum amazonense]TWB42458.1 phospholipid-binding lipoprotein MlaA [Nitrospirillum amazonense]